MEVQNTLLMKCHVGFCCLHSRQDVDSIQLQVDGKVRSFAEWTRDFVDTYYPHLGQRCYRVPALHFNRQRLVGEKGLEYIELHAPVRQSAGI